MADIDLPANPVAWLADFKPVLDAESHHAKKVAIAKIRAKVVEERTSKTTSKKKVNDTLALNKRRFKSYKSLWDRMGSDSASEEFDRLRSQQGDEFDSGDEEKVGIKDNTAFRESSGTKV